MLSIAVLSERLSALNAGTGGVYSTADLEVVLERANPSRLTEAIRGLTADGVLLRVRRGLYVDRLHGYRPEIAGWRWVTPCYLSTETALDRHRLCETGILAYTYLTTRLIARRELAVRRLEGREFVYRHIARPLFFGFAAGDDGLLVADPEKAVLDFLYFLYKRQRSVVAVEDVDFSRLHPARYRRHLEAYRQAGFRDYAVSRLPGGAR